MEKKRGNCPRARLMGVVQTSVSSSVGNVPRIWLFSMSDSWHRRGVHVRFFPVSVPARNVFSSTIVTMVVELNSVVGSGP